MFSVIDISFPFTPSTTSSTSASSSLSRPLSIIGVSAPINRPNSPPIFCSPEMMLKTVEQMKSRRHRGHLYDNMVNWPGKEPLTIEEMQKEENEDELLYLIKNLRLHSQYCDLTVKCGDAVFPVHKCIVCPRSEFFTKACNGNFKESTTHEIDLSEEDASLVEKMLDFLYTLNYEAPDTDPEGQLDDSQVKAEPQSDSPTISQGKQTLLSPGCEEEASPILPTTQMKFAENIYSFGTDCSAGQGSNFISFHILMYSLADRMMIRGLKDLARAKVQQCFIHHLDSNSFPNMIEEIYSTTPAHDRGLRDVAVDFTMNYISTLRISSKGLPAAFQDDLLKTVPQFCYDFCVASMNKTMSQWDRVGICEKDWGW